jgi:nanoRNase/pAp phosphatase (c-di-AMP/oligoRNAs hydrolase)
MQVSESEFGALMRRHENILYLCHRNADPDAIGSAFALQQAFGGSLGVAEDLSRSGKSLADALGVEILIDPRSEDFEFVVVVDTSVRLQLGSAKLSSYAVVDHHLDSGLISGAKFYIQRPANSTAEIVWKILRSSGRDVTREAGLGLMVGIISDTGRFRRASSESFQACAEILHTGVEYEEALEVLAGAPADLSQRIAALKAASRAAIEREGDWIVATAEINAFEGSSAMTLVDIGADVAFAAGRHGSLTRVSARARREASRAGLDLAEVMREVARAHRGEGGGHRAAAALESEGEPLDLLKECRKKAIERLKPEA